MDPQSAEEDSMKTFWKVAGIAALVALLGVVVVGAMAFAQEPEDGADWPFNFRERLHQAVADVLGITVQEYDTAVETARGQTLDEAVTEGWLTQDQADRMRERVEEGFGPGMGGMFHGGPRGGMFGPGDSFISVAAEELGMTVQDLVAELQDGKTLANVADEKSVDPQVIVDAFVAQHTERLNEAVAEGRITQEQADSMTQQMTEEVQEHLSESFPFEGGGPGGCEGGMLGGHRHGGPSGGRMQSFPGQTDA
jgi:polyhydroxyalkanoate synthesis regulator phasin